MSDWIDLTRTVTESMIQWPDDPPYRRQQVQEITGNGTVNLSAISGSVHIGTHIDAPLHFIPGGADVAALPLWKLCGPAVVVQVRAARDVAVEDFENAGIQNSDRVLLKTANEGLWRKPAFDPAYVAISARAARWLADRGVLLVGVDYLSIDRYDDPAKPAHHALLGAGIVVVEGLDLSQIAPGRYEMVALPLKLAGSDGSPARVIVRPLGQ